MKPEGWTISCEPRAVQVEAFKRGANRDRYGYFMEQGLGKTAVTLADFKYNLERGNVTDMVVIIPGYLRGTWRDETLQWGVGIPIYFWPDTVPNPAQPFIFVINYEAILYSGGKYLDKIIDNGTMLVIEESSSIKDWKGKWAKRVMGFASITKYHRALTGTPMTQNVMDLWTQIRFCGGVSGVNPIAWKNEYAVTGGYMGKQLVGIKEDKLPQLHAIIDSCAFRALKEDWWADMPEKVYQFSDFEMAHDQREMYAEMHAEFAAMLPPIGQYPEGEVFAEQAIHAMMKLQQISRGFIITNEKKPRPIVDPRKNPALLALRDTLVAIRGKRIIFAYHKYSVDMLEQWLAPLGPLVTLRGQMKPNEIDFAKRLFNDDPKFRTLIAQLNVGARGHTLLGSKGADRCSTTIYYENLYSLEVRLQSEDRNHRFGQDRAVNYIDLRGSHMDDKILTALQQKQDLVRAAVDGARAIP